MSVTGQRVWLPRYCKCVRYKTFMKHGDLYSVGVKLIESEIQTARVQSSRETGSFKGVRIEDRGFNS
jgi:hypothetical protein